MVAPASPALEILHRVFGYEAFRGQQAAIVQRVIDGGDALVLMPTGGGKSLCYQIPALVRSGTGVVISPLIALMQDQVDALSAVGVRAAFLNSTQDSDERRRVEAALLAGELDLVYLAPERLKLSSTLDLLDRSPVALFAIDEAHCVSQWGHDFRPDYLALSVLHERWPAVPRIALTATATEQTRREIAARLDLGDAELFVSSFDRPNIQYRIEPKAQPLGQLLQLIRAEHPGEAGIVYCLSRASVEKTADALVAEGIAALPYHAGLDAATRARNQSRFLREDGVVMVATIAFGMGIDKPDVRFVAHLDLPKSVEGYYQETGRAGRDGLPSTAWLAYGLQDVVQQRRMIDESEGDLAHRRKLSAAPRRHAGALRDDRVPPGAVAQLLRAAVGRVRQLRHLPVSARVVGRHGARPEAALDGGAVVARAPSALRRRAPHRHPAGPRDRAGAQPVARRAAPPSASAPELNEQEWRGVVRQLLAQGLLGVAADGYGTLVITDASASVLDGSRMVLLRRETAKPTRAAKSKAGVELPVEARPLFERLREWRAGVAREQGVPAYIVFGDATLRGIALTRPSSLEQLGTISGVGEKKLESYGEGVLGVVAEESAAA